MNKILAWFMTFNFVNFAWIFFRAKEFEDAIKVIKGMVGLGGVVLPNALSNKLGFLGEYGVGFASFVANLNGDYFNPVWVVFAFVVVLGLRYSCGRL